MSTRFGSPGKPAARRISPNAWFIVSVDSGVSVNVGQHRDVQLVGITPHRHSEGAARRKQPEIGHPRHVSRNVLTCRERDSRLSGDESVGAEIPDFVGGDGMGGGLVGVCARLLRDEHDCLHGHRGHPPRIDAFAQLPRRACFFHQLR